MICALLSRHRPESGAAQYLHLGPPRRVANRSRSIAGNICAKIAVPSLVVAQDLKHTSGLLASQKIHWRPTPSGAHSAQDQCRLARIGLVVRGLTQRYEESPDDPGRLTSLMRRSRAGGFGICQCVYHLAGWVAESQVPIPDPKRAGRAEMGGQ